MRAEKLLELIRGRRSIRRFEKEKVCSEVIEKILEAARWAPSGLNNQPWKFKVVEANTKDSLAKFTHYSRIVKEADKLILVFLDKKSSYHREKDLMAIGASIQNMLLCIHSLGLGGCWLGEILKRKRSIQKYLDIPSNLELVAVIAIGYPLVYSKKGKRKSLRKLILK